LTENIRNPKFTFIVRKTRLPKVIW